MPVPYRAVRLTDGVTWAVLSVEPRGQLGVTYFDGPRSRERAHEYVEMKTRGTLSPRVPLPQPSAN